MFLELNFNYLNIAFRNTFIFIMIIIHNMLFTLDFNENVEKILILL